MENKYKYTAFISYRHISPDKEIADKLQKKLENYKPPRSLSIGKRSGGLRIFRDETELPTSSNLSNDIKTALENSEYLIVICSETTSESRWCMEEIDYFKQLHNGNNSNIITLVADGNPEDVFPPALCNELIPVTDESGNTTYQNHVVEPLAANVSGKSLKESLKKLNTEFLRIAAPLLGCGYDNLYNREHKKKIRRIFTIGGVVVSLLLLFAVYNSTMLWQINNQRIALAEANTDLYKKTEDLNLSNENLKKSNEDLAKKTKEAEDNLAEANRQRKAAEENLAEAEAQRKIAETNLSEANRQKQIAEANLAEANRQKQIAEANLTEANRQQSIAEANAQEANTQRNIAEDNMRIAQENEAKANEANKNLRIKNSEILATQAQIYFEKDDLTSAISTAIEALPQNGEDIPENVDAKYVLSVASNAYGGLNKLFNNRINLSGYVSSLDFSADGTRLFATDTMGNIYIIDYENSKVIKTYTVLDTFGQTDNYISDIAVDGDSAYVLCDGQLISINLKDGSMNWHYAPEDSDKYDTGDEIITNPDSNYIFLPCYFSYTFLTKDGKEVLHAEKNNDTNYNYSSQIDYVHMDANGTVYMIHPRSSTIHLINQKVSILYPIDIKNDDEVLFVGENADCIYLNIGVAFDGSYFGYTDARLICINKNDMSVKWSTNYTVDGALYGTSYNTIFDFTHVLQTADKNNEKHISVLVASGSHILCFDKQTGELYYRAKLDGEENILYCVPNTTEYSLKIASSKMFASKVYLFREITTNDPSNVVTNDYLYSTGVLTFDTERKYVAHSGESKFALASQYSSEVNMYHSVSSENRQAFVNYPISDSSLYMTTDDGQGTIATFHRKYNNNEPERYIVIYDTRNDICKAFFKVDIDVSAMVFKSNKLLIFDYNGNSKVVNYSGQILEEFNLKEIINIASGLEPTNYVSLYDLYIHLSKNNVVLCIPQGMYAINLSQEHVVVDKILSGNNLKNYHITDNLVSFTVDSYTDKTTKIAYFMEGDKTLSWVTENGKEATFVKDSILSVTNTTTGNRIAFINKEGYIGLYSYGEDSIDKIMLPQGEVDPLSIQFTPDGDYLLAMCAGGKFIKYNVATGEVAGEYKSEIKIDGLTVFTFMDNNSFCIKGGLNQVFVVDLNSMRKLAEMNKCIFYLNSEKKVICSYYNSNGKYEMGYYKYLTTSELIEIAKRFLEKN